MSDALRKRVLGKVRQCGECWLWCGYTTKGVPRMVISTDADRALTGVRSRAQSAGPQVAYVRRVSWALHTGAPPPKEGFISSTCHNALCVSPHHAIHVDTPQTPNAALSDVFWDYVDVRGYDDCWVWLQGCSVNSYGSVSLSKTDADKLGFRPGTIGAHCIAWVLVRGRLRGKARVVHTCGNPPCVNPNHLRLDTDIGEPEEPEEPEDPREPGDPWERRTHESRGSHGNQGFKLTDEDITEIRRLRSEGMKIASLAERYSVGCSTVRWHLRKHK